MAKQKIGGNFTCPMPVVMVGAVIDGSPNFMTAAWFTTLNIAPLLVGVSLGKGRYTTQGVLETGQFSINLPSVRQVALADYCGLVSGRDENKAAQVDVFFGELESAPMVGQCPLTMECRVTQTVELPDHYLFVGVIVGVYGPTRRRQGGPRKAAALRPLVGQRLSGPGRARGGRLADRESAAGQIAASGSLG
jgi:flavin reductase (DIM6/NTAB) family NADH-FMN oxidoreductase RutF